ncbi:MAG: hypothetical protein Kow0079_10220 [Vicingaceae bacterium]
MGKIALTLDDDIDFSLIGISCHEKAYKLCWEINKALKVDLVRVKDFKIERNNEKLEFPFYEYVDDENFKSYFIIKNRSKDGYLFPDLKQFDYFFKIKGNYINLNEVSNTLKSNCSSVLMAQSLDPEKIKNYQYLIF